jgi:hypothetical protein
MKLEKMTDGSTKRMNDRAHHGGARARAGRKKGTRSGRAIFEAKSLRERFPIFPLEFMLMVLNDVDEPAAFRADMAKAAAPYIHPRLAAVEVTGKDRGPEPSLDLSKLSDEELSILERIVAKAQKTVTIDNDEVVPQIEYDDSGFRQ